MPSTALFTTMPTSITLPMRLCTLSDVPVSSSVGTTPMSASGSDTATITITGSRKRSNRAAITMEMRITATMIDSRECARPPGAGSRRR